MIMKNKFLPGNPTLNQDYHKKIEDINPDVWVAASILMATRNVNLGLFDQDWYQSGTPGKF